MFKRILVATIAIVLVASLGLAGAWALGQTKPAVQAQTPAPSEVKYNAAQIITVVGQGTASVVPDIARITLGVETTAATVADGSTENQAKMKALLAALKAVGIPEKDIQTTNYSIMVNRGQEQPVTELGKTGTAATSYTVSNNVTVTIRDLTLVSEVIDAAIEAGANNIWGISFTVEKPDAGLADARAKAMADAKLRAEALAKLGEVTLGPVMSMSEVIGSSSPVMYAIAERGLGGDTSVSIGEVEVSYQIQVSYYIEP